MVPLAPVTRIMDRYAASPGAAVIGSFGTVTVAEVTVAIAMRVPSRLRWWVADVAVLRTGEGDGQPLVHLPDPHPALIFRVAPTGRGDLVVVGPRTRASYYAGKHLPLCLRLRLRAGAARPLLGRPVSGLVDQVIPLGDLWAEAARLADRLTGSRNDPGRVLRQLEVALLRRISALPATDLARGTLVRAAVDTLTRVDTQRERLPALAHRFAVSERHLRNVFHDSIGLAPTRLERITRLRRILFSEHAHTGRWAQAATAARYYDQSHMIAEFRTMMGVTPAAYFADRRPPPQRCNR